MRVALAIAIAFAAIAPMSLDASAKTKVKAHMGHSSQKCVGTALDNSKVSFKCSAKQKCCFDAVAKKGSCVAASAACI